MARAVFQSFATDDEGNVLPSASVTVINEDSGTPATLYNAYSGGSSISNPFNADANGFFVFYCDPQRVKITVTLGGDTVEFRNVRLTGTAAQADLTSPSATVWDDGNLNPNLFNGGANEETLLTGVMISGTDAVFYAYTMLLNEANNITYGGSFKIRNITKGIAVNTGITSLTLSGNRTPKITRFIEPLVTGSDIGDVLELRCDGGAASILIEE